MIKFKFIMGALLPLFAFQASNAAQVVDAKTDTRRMSDLRPVNRSAVKNGATQNNNQTTRIGQTSPENRRK